MVHYNMRYSCIPFEPKLPHAQYIQSSSKNEGLKIKSDV